MKQILVATDFSAHAERALEYALALAKLFDAKLELMTSAWVPPIVTSDPVPLSIGGVTVPAGFLQAAREQAAARLDAAAAPLREAGIDVTCTVMLEEPSSAICAHAEEIHADLLALGTRGLSGLKHVLIGSVAERTARNAPCPVLTAHSDSPPAGAFQKLLVPTDFSDTAQGALRFAQAIAAKSGGTLLLQHASHIPISLETDAFRLDAPVFEGLEREAQRKLAEVEKGLDVATESFVTRGIPDVEIVEQAREQGADLIVMGTRGRTGLAHLLLGSTAERVIRRATAPVISVGRHG
ncbi:MAG: universal stress protein [Deltaproteobacteria bacterium]|nr:universal stress protein [Deltaproteobacteria bacterium]MBW2413367.1 universal stress protein [Deltaproteobacteria bacterium]